MWKSDRKSRESAGKVDKIVGTESNPTKMTSGQVIINKKATKQNLSKLKAINEDGLNQKQTGKTTTDGTNGGLLKGPPHYDENGNTTGGIPVVVDNSRNIEVEGEEFVVNAEASKKHWQELSKINQSTGNGVAIGPPSGAVDDDPEEYDKGGKIQFNPNHVPNKWILAFAEKVRTQHPKVWDLGGNIFGNEAYKNLKRVAERGYWLDSEEWMYIKWQSYIARHKKDFRIAGVIAMLKWVDKVDRGWVYMKDLIQERIKKEEAKKGWKHKNAPKMNGGGPIDMGSKKFMQWYIDWYKGISNLMNITFSLPNQLLPFKENNVVILDLFEKKKQDIDAKKYLYEIVKKANELGVVIYLEPNPSHKYFFTNEAKKKKITKEYLIDYYTNFGFEVTQNKKFMKRLPKMSGGGDLIKRADGTYSKRGLWDNIRDNIGSGKKPTKQMLEQEAKIKREAKYHLGGDMSKHLAPNGKPSNLTHEHWHLVRTPEFKAWFGDWEHDPANASKVVDENGEPLVVYRGVLNKERFVFDKTKDTDNDREHYFNWKYQVKWNEWGTFFSNSRSIAEKYSEYPKGKVIQVFLNIRTPLKKTSKQPIFWAQIIPNIFNSNYSKYNDKHDGFIVKNIVERDDIVSDTYHTKHPNQIKLADGSNTTFDDENPDIRFDGGGSTDEADKIKLEIIKLNTKAFKMMPGSPRQKEVIKQIDELRAKLEAMGGKFEDGGGTDTDKALTKYAKRIEENFKFMKAPREEWKSLPIIGFNEIEVNGNLKKMPIFEYPKNYVNAPTLYPSSKNPPYNCELCGQMNISTVYWIKNDTKKYLLGVGSECVTHFEEGKSGKENERSFKVAKAIILDNDMANLKKFIRDTYTRKESLGYGRTGIKWVNISTPSNAGDSYKEVSDLKESGELNILYDDKKLNKFDSKNLIYTIYVYDKIPVFGYEKSVQVGGQSADKIEKDLLAWYSRNEKLATNIYESLVKLFKAINTDFDESQYEFFKEIGTIQSDYVSKMSGGGGTDSRDTVTFDIPLLIRTLELAREDVGSDADLHRIVENLIKLKNKPVLTMDDYNYIAHIKKHTEKMKEGGTTQAQRDKIAKVMHEYKEHKLHSGSANGPIVTDRDQAIAIALSEANASKYSGGGLMDELKPSDYYNESQLEQIDDYMKSLNLIKLKVLRDGRLYGIYWVKNENDKYAVIRYLYMSRISVDDDLAQDIIRAVKPKFGSEETNEKLKAQGKKSADKSFSYAFVNWIAKELGNGKDWVNSHNTIIDLAYSYQGVFTIPQKGDTTSGQYDSQDIKITRFGDGGTMYAPGGNITDLKAFQKLNQRKKNLTWFTADRYKYEKLLLNSLAGNKYLYDELEFYKKNGGKNLLIDFGKTDWTKTYFIVDIRCVNCYDSFLNLTQEFQFKRGKPVSRKNNIVFSLSTANSSFGRNNDIEYTIDELIEVANYTKPDKPKAPKVAKDVELISGLELLLSVSSGADNKQIQNLIDKLSNDKYALGGELESNESSQLSQEEMDRRIMESQFGNI